jgi:uncharacterized repeat protein (TIGR03803 family)
LRRIAFFVGFAVVILAIIGLTGYLIYRSIIRPRHDAKAEAAGVTVSAFVNFPDDKVFPDGLAVAPDGTLYLTTYGTGQLYKVDSTGKFMPFIADKTKLTAPGAVAVASDGTVYVLDFINGLNGVGLVKKVAPDGSVTALSGADNADISLLGTLALDGANNVYVTTGAAGVWRFTPDGTGTLWWAAPSATDTPAKTTGLAYDSAHKALLVGDSGSGTIYRVDVASKTSTTLYQKADFNVQAIALDDQGRPLIANWVHDSAEFSRLESDGTLVLLADGFRAPTAIAVEQGKAYVVNSDITGLVAPDLFGVLPSPLRAKPPFTVDVVTLGN